MKRKTLKKKRCQVCDMMISVCGWAWKAHQDKHKRRGETVENKLELFKEK